MYFNTHTPINNYSDTSMFAHTHVQVLRVSKHDEVQSDGTRQTLIGDAETQVGVRARTICTTETLCVLNSDDDNVLEDVVVVDDNTLIAQYNKDCKVFTNACVCVCMWLCLLVLMLFSVVLLKGV